MAVQAQPLHQSVLIPLDGGGAGTIEFRGQSVVCYCGRHGWCEHAETVLAERRDMLYTLLRSERKGHVSIPLFPSHQVWVPIYFEQIGTDMTMWKAEISELNVKAALPPEDLFLGVLGMDDSRLTVRSMVLQWFRPYFQKDAPCGASSHGMSDVVAEQRARRNDDKPYIMANAWCLRWTGMCMRCLDRTKSALESVPEPEPTRSPWS